MRNTRAIHARQLDSEFLRHKDWDGYTHMLYTHVSSESESELIE